MTKASSHFDDCSLPLHLANPPAAQASLADKIVHLRRMGEWDGRRRRGWMGMLWANMGDGKGV